MSKVIKNIKFDDTLSLTECNDGFWLYDSIRGMNLSVRAKTDQAALFEALKYYQKRLAVTENNLNVLQGKVLGFIELFVHEVDYGSSSDIPSSILEINI